MPWVPGLRLPPPSSSVGREFTLSDEPGGTAGIVRGALLRQALAGEPSPGQTPFGHFPKWAPIPESSLRADGIICHEKYILIFYFPFKTKFCLVLPRARGGREKMGRFPHPLPLYYAAPQLFHHFNLQIVFKFQK